MFGKAPGRVSNVHNTASVCSFIHNMVLRLIRQLILNFGYNEKPRLRTALKCAARKQLLTAAASLHPKFSPGFITFGLDRTGSLLLDSLPSESFVIDINESFYKGNRKSVFLLSISYIMKSLVQCFRSASMLSPTSCRHQVPLMALTDKAEKMVYSSTYFVFLKHHWELMNQLVWSNHLVFIHMFLQISPLVLWNSISSVASRLNWWLQ